MDLTKISISTISYCAITATIIAHSVLGSQYYLHNQNISAYISGLSVATSIVIGLFQIISKKGQASIYAVLVSTWITIVAQTFAHGGLHSPNVMIFVMIGPIIIALGQGRVGVLFSGASIITVLILYFAHKLNLLPVELVITEGQRAYSAIAGSISFSFVSVFHSIRVKRLTANLESERSQTQENEVKRRVFLTNINHELRNPLTALLSASEELEKNSLDDFNLILSKTLKSTSSHILFLINDILENERLQTSNVDVVKEYFSISECVRDSIDMFSFQANASDITISTDLSLCAGDIWFGMKQRLQQVIVNLISNSLKHGANTSILIKASSKNAGLSIVIENNGYHIHLDKIDKLFEPYTSSQGQIGSTGLGLPICKQLVSKIMNGTIDVENKIGGGVSFNIWLPFDLKPELPKKAAYQTKPISNLKENFCLADCSILLVEDDRINQETLSILMRKYGAKAYTASNSADAINLLNEIRFDAIVVDRNLGEYQGSNLINGIELTSLISKLDQGVVIGFSGLCPPETIKQWLSAGASEILQKPVPFSIVAKTICKHLLVANPAGAAH